MEDDFAVEYSEVLEQFHRWNVIATSEETLRMERCPAMHAHTPFPLDGGWSLIED